MRSGVLGGFLGVLLAATFLVACGAGAADLSKLFTTLEDRVIVLEALNATSASNLAAAEARLAASEAALAAAEADIAAAEADIAAGQADLAGAQADLAVVANATTDNDTRITTNADDIAALGHVGAIYRYAIWSSYDQSHGWYANNDPGMFGGVAPQRWGDANGEASQLSADKDVLRTLFCRKGHGGKNAVVCAQQWKVYSSTNSRHAAALFRIRNTTNAPIAWTVKCYQTAYGGWGERASVALNGASVWSSGGSNLGAGTIQTHTLTVPANRISTAVFIAGSDSPSGEVRACYLAFRDNTLALPTGLEYVDDFDTATGGWEQ